MISEIAVLEPPGDRRHLLEILAMQLRLRAHRHEVGRGRQRRHAAFGTGERKLAQPLGIEPVAIGKTHAKIDQPVAAPHLGRHGAKQSGRELRRHLIRRETGLRRARRIDAHFELRVALARCDDIDQPLDVFELRDHTLGDCESVA